MSFQERHAKCNIPEEFRKDFESVPEDCKAFLCLPEARCMKNHPEASPKLYVRYICPECKKP